MRKWSTKDGNARLGGRRNARSHRPGNRQDKRHIPGRPPAQAPERTPTVADIEFGLRLGDVEQTDRRLPVLMPGNDYELVGLGTRRPAADLDNLPRLGGRALANDFRRAAHRDTRACLTI